MKYPTPYARHQVLWFSYCNPATGKWKSARTPFRVGDEKKAERYIVGFINDLHGLEGAMPTVAVYADRWLARRRELGYASAGDDDARIRLHVLPVLGHMLVNAVRPRHAADLVLDLRAKGELAPRTIRKVAGALHTMFGAAKRDELIDSNPIDFERGILPANVDKDPSWRHQAIYTHDELEQLLSDVRIPMVRRVLYGLKMNCLRHSEAAELPWSRYIRTREPLGGFDLTDTKSGVPRAVPVHPATAALLAEWRLSGWAAMMGRQPGPDDLIVPVGAVKGNRPGRTGGARTATQSQKDLIRDLKTLGMRVEAGEERKRRGHDLRRAFITLARVDGARKDVLEQITHGPRGDIMNVYTTLPWSALCEEVAKLKIRYRARAAEVVQLRAVAGAEEASPLQPGPLQTPLQVVAAPNKGTSSRAVTKLNRATPTGFEGVTLGQTGRQTGDDTGPGALASPSKSEPPVVARYSPRSGRDLNPWQTASEASGTTGSREVAPSSADLAPGAAPKLGAVAPGGPLASCDLGLASLRAGEGDPEP